MRNRTMTVFITCFVCPACSYEWGLIHHPSCVDLSPYDRTCDRCRSTGYLLDTQYADIHLTIPDPPIFCRPDPVVPRKRPFWRR